MGSIHDNKSHAVCFPAPAQGHINSMLKLAKLLHSKGFMITFVVTEYDHQRLLRSLGSDALKDRPSFHFETYSDGLPPPKNPNVSPDTPSLVKSILAKGLGQIKSVFAKASADYSPVTCMVADILMGYTLTAAEELGVPAVLLWTSGPGSLICFDQIANLIQKGLMPLKEWLDGKEPLSVVYVNFGSIIVMTPQQLVEFCWGLAKSRQSFVWVIRPDLLGGDSVVLPPEFLAETSNRGMFVSWCPQEKVLSHPSIGGFLTHSGWNSTLESISYGVPMICWPFFSDQQPNCWLSCNKWKIALEIDNNVKRNFEASDRVDEWRKGKRDEKQCH